MLNRVLLAGIITVIVLISGLASADSTSYIHGANGQLIAKINKSNITYYHSDHLGSTSAVTDEKGEVVEEQIYLPFGERVSGNGRYGFTKKELDGTGLQYFGARYYNPTVGRFLRTDPALQDFTSYAYAGNNPLTRVDPDGRLFIEKIENTLETIETATWKWWWNDKTHPPGLEPQFNMKDSALPDWLQELQKPSMGYLSISDFIGTQEVCPIVAERVHELDTRDIEDILRVMPYHVQKVVFFRSTADDELDSIEKSRRLNREEKAGSDTLASKTDLNVIVLTDIPLLEFSIFEDSLDWYRGWLLERDIDLYVWPNDPVYGYRYEIPEKWIKKIESGRDPIGVERTKNGWRLFYYESEKDN